jgi:hypothetical protein
MGKPKLIALILVAAAFAFLAGSVLTSKMESTQAQGRPGLAFPAVFGGKGGEDMTGPYDVDPDWPKPLTSLPGHEKWTWGAVEDIFGESPNPVFIAQRGELPALARDFLRQPLTETLKRGSEGAPLPSRTHSRHRKGLITATRPSATIFR